MRPLLALLQSPVSACALEPGAILVLETRLVGLQVADAHTINRVNVATATAIRNSANRNACRAGCVTDIADVLLHVLDEPLAALRKGVRFQHFVEMCGAEFTFTARVEALEVFPAELGDGGRHPELLGDVASHDFRPAVGDAACHEHGSEDREHHRGAQDKRPREACQSADDDRSRHSVHDHLLAAGTRQFSHHYCREEILDDDEEQRDEGYERSVHVEYLL